MLERSFFAFAVLAFSNGALAGSVITTNLPSDAVAIVNVSGTNDGARKFDGDQSSWFQPFTIDDVLTELTLGPGTYTFDLIDPTDAQAAFPSLTSTQLGQIYSGWTYNSPWITDYFVFDSSALNDQDQPQLFAGATGGPAFGSGEDAYHAAKSGGYSSRLFTGPGGRLHGIEASSFTLTNAQTLIFVVPDYYLPDNNGGVSVVVRAVPEPTSFGALALGGLTLLIKRRQPRTTRS